MRLRDRIETGFARWGRLLHRNAPATLVATLLVLAGLVSQLGQLEVEVSDESFLHENDPVRVTHARFRAQFERDELILIGIRPPEVFALDFLEKLRAFHEDLERSVPHVQDVTSLVNARHTHGVGDELRVDDLLEEWPRGPADLAALRQRVLAHPLYRNLYVSEDGRLTALVIELDTYTSLGARDEELSGFAESATHEAGSEPGFITGAEVFAAVDAVREVVRRHEAPDFELFVTGGPVSEATLMTAMQRDIALFVGLSLFMITGLLFALFRRLSGVVLPLLVVVLALVCTIATMAWAGVPVTLPMQVLPIFLLAVGVCDSVHVLALFYRDLERGTGHEEAIGNALGHSGLAIAMTSLTTAGGLASFATADLAPVMHFGIFGPIGVLFAFVLTVVLLPALLAVTPLRAGAGPRRDEPLSRDRWERGLARCGLMAVRHPRAVLGVAAACLLVAGAGTTRLRFSWEPLTWFPETAPVRVATELIDREMGGSGSFELLVDAGDENGLQNPELLRRLDELARFVASFERDGIRSAKTVSAADVLKEIHQALNENRPEYYAIPADRRLVAQEFLLFENTGADDLEDLVDTRFRLGSFTVRVPLFDAMVGIPYLDAIGSRFAESLAGLAEVTMTGALVINARAFDAMIRSMAESYVIALLVITPLMVLMLGSLRGGLVCMIPNVAPVVLTLGMMGWLDVPIDFSTMMGGAIVLSIAVDDTIHFAHGFRRYHARTRDPRASVQLTLETTGRAMLFTSIVLTSAFLIYTFATMQNLFNMGVFTAFAIVTAFLADVLLAPALLVLLERRREGAAALAAGRGLARRAGRA